MLSYLSLMPCINSLVSRTCVLYDVHIFLQQSPNSVVNRTVWPTHIWKDKIRCFVLKSCHFFTSLEWRQNASFPSQLFKAYKVSKNKETWKVEYLYHFRKCVDAVYQKLSTLVHACWNYSLSKLARFLETVWILRNTVCKEAAEPNTGFFFENHAKYRLNKS